MVQQYFPLYYSLLQLNGAVSYGHKMFTKLAQICRRQVDETHFEKFSKFVLQCASQITIETINAKASDFEEAAFNVYGEIGTNKNDVIQGTG
jgi:hypothetical protein